MLPHDDCLELSEHIPEEAAAPARPGSLREPQEGRQAIRRILLDGIEDACRQGDTRTAAGLGLVLHHMLGARQAQDAPAASQVAADRLLHALRIDPRAARWVWVRERLDVYMATMLRQFGLDPASVRERFPTQMHVAEMCCATCTETGPCGRFLATATGAEAVPSFCPNAALFHELREQDLLSRDAA